MTDRIQRFRRLETLFDSALEYPSGAERDSFVERQCEADSEMRADLCRLLADHERVSASVVKPEAPLPRFGPWQAVRLLGRGGMGTVYLAERADGAFRMTAAVKVAPLALMSPDIEERFRRERQFLASLDHPKVASLIDGGVTPAGVPYLVMEFVDGVAIDRYCEAQRLDARARIGLMRQVLEALLYVHGNRVLHRDVKPSNILVDAAGNAKLLDFGTARLADASGDDAITKTGVFAFTPEYASPEQMQGKPLTVASDIYSAGALLYRLLTGRLPHPSSGNAAGAEPEASRLDKPLEAVLSTALRADPAERYASIAEFDADLARYLEGQAVRARRHRNWPRAAAAAALVVASAAALWFAFHGAAPPPPSIAVLPFRNLSAEPGSEYLSSGLTSEITSALSESKSLRVIASASAAQFGNKTADLTKAAGVLHVTHVLNGSMELKGARVHVVASLARTSGGAQLWTNTYDRPLAELSAIETDLDSALSRTLGIAQPAARKKHVPTQQAHELYLKARYEENQPTVAANAAAEQDYRRATEADPSYAAAWSGLGGAIWNRSSVSGAPAVQADLASAAGMFQKAIQLDPGFAPAHDSLGLYAMYTDWDWNRAEREFQAALATGHSAGAEMHSALLCLITGRRAEADEHLRRSRDLDPISTAGTLNYSQDLLFEGRFAESRDELRKVAGPNPATPRLQIALLAIDARVGQAEESVSSLRKLSQPQPLVNQNLAMALALAGHREESLEIIRSMEQANADGHVPMSWFATAYGEAGDEPDTVKYLDKAIDLHEAAAIYIHISPSFAKMQDTPEFHRLKRRMRLDW